MKHECIMDTCAVCEEKQREKLLDKIDRRDQKLFVKATQIRTVEEALRRANEGGVIQEMLITYAIDALKPLVKTGAMAQIGQRGDLASIEIAYQKLCDAVGRSPN